MLSTQTGCCCARNKKLLGVRAFIFSAFSWMVMAPDTTFFSASIASASAWMAVLSVCAWPSEAPIWFCRSKASKLVCCATACRSSPYARPQHTVDCSLICAEEALEEPKDKPN